MELINLNILIISPESWGICFVSKHHYAIELTKRGNKVFFLNPPKSTETDFEVKPVFGYNNLFEINYPLSLRGLNRLPFILTDFFSGFIVRKILRATTKLDIVWSFDPYRFQNLDIFRAKKKIYCSADPIIIHKQKMLGKKADIIITYSNMFSEKLSKFLEKNVYNIGHGVSGKFFERCNVKNELELPGKNTFKVGYVGNLNYKYLDKQILLNIITCHQNIDFIFLGPYEKSNLSHVKTTEDTNYIKQLTERKNVFLLGPKTVREVKYYLHHFDLLLLCYKRYVGRIFTANNHKLLEYLSSGKTIVSHYVDEYKNRGDLLQMADINGDLSQVFSKTVENIESLNSEENRIKRITFAKKHVYDRQLKKIEELLINSTTLEN